MTSQALIAALHLPPESLITRRITKKLLLEQIAARTRFTAAQRRLLQQGIDELTWIAALKPSNAGVAAFRDATREYGEIAVLSVHLRPTASAAGLLQLLHRSIPYPVLLVAEQARAVTVSLAHKRWSAGEHGETVAEELLCSPSLDESPSAQAFAASLSLAAIAAPTLLALYQAWADRVTALEAAQLTGRYTVSRVPEHAVRAREHLEEYRRLGRELAALRAQAMRQKQINRRVDLNLAAQQLESQRAQIIESLTSNP